VQNISSLENVHKDEDIYIIASGKSCDYIDPLFFKDRIAIGVNAVFRRFKHLNYIVYKDGTPPTDRPDIPLIMSQYSHGMLAYDKTECDYYFEHNNNGCSDIDFNGLHPHGDKLVVSFSTITSAIHLAAFMGARTIFLIGHDCASLDDQFNLGGYTARGEDTKAWYGDWLSRISTQTALLREYLRIEYGMPLVSISPFIGLKHEGHKIS